MVKNERKPVTIAELRAKNGKMSQKELGDVLGTSQTTVSQWEKNIRSISTPYLIQVCRHFNVSADDLLDI